ncbi:Domain of unknown function DUF551 [uncultured Caudovirales phage]|uniref:DUF551 domain-containing protein n=1 Tax=uncultured Caudovirales phage TaxID=2100421 RepID=A0A6J5NXH9_9CAUD|nr:Domain of unknown function DUF551 [uncultured Caudovirales phage]
MTDKSIEALYKAINGVDEIISQPPYTPNQLHAMKVYSERLVSQGYTITPLAPSDEKQTLGCVKQDLTCAQLREAVVDIQKRVWRMCENYSGPKMTIPPHPDDDDLAIQAHLKTIEAALAELERRRAGSEWQPIETAPRDGTNVLAYCPVEHEVDNNFYIRTVFFDETEWRCEDDLQGCTCNPTHWMPLPPPPATEKENG